MRTLFVLAALSLTGCAIETSPTDDGESASTEAAARKNDPCMVVRCAAGTQCVARGKTATCEPVGEACGGVTCAVGDVCCNASCGICTPPGGVCTQQVCGATN
jgi:hypothetical protein